MATNRGGRPRAIGRAGPDIFISWGDEEDTIVAADRVVCFSEDGQRRTDELLNLTHKKRRIEPTDLNDRLAEWIPVPDDPSDFLNATDDEEPTPGVGAKRKRYDSSDDPMSIWRPVKQTFMDAMLWHDGFGYDSAEPRCALCQAASPPDASGDARVRLFRCSTCGDFLQCRSCCLERHQRTPLHLLEEWNGAFWVTQTLKSLGLVYQMGHGGGSCIFPDPLKRTMTVLEHPHVHQVVFQYCNCNRSDEADSIQQLLRNSWYPATATDPGTCATFRTLEIFRLQNVVGNMNVHDFITAMERQTNATGSTGLDRVPSRYKEFMRMSRQWAFLKRMKRAGRGHDPAGVDATSVGRAAVVCWACPYDGRNLPSNWRDIDPKYAFLFMLIVALDANFKLKNRIRANARDDPPLGAGWEYFVEPKRYKEHIKNYVPEKDISSCIAFAALLQKDTRATAGLRVSGVGGCVCARHECVRPNGIGDLQKGERYANMDFILFCALLGFSLLWLTISYDIACQWKKNLIDRMKKLPKSIQIPLETITWQCALPVWHAGSHESDCQNANSLSFKPGVGKSDGEGVERTWSVLNPASYHTKDMNRGNREDTLNDKVDNHNFLKNIGQGYALENKLIIAIAERAKQVDAFVTVNATVDREVCRRRPKCRLQLQKEEEAEALAGRTPIHGTSATAFITAGMQLEESQRRIMAELKGLALVAPDRESKIQERRIAFFPAFIPGAASLISEEEADRDSDAPPPKAEKIKLWMPHEMSDSDRTAGCVRGLVDIEIRLRVSQCLNALVLMRSRLHAKRHFLMFRTENVHGQINKTKAAMLVAQLGERVTACTERYRKGHAALLRLQHAAIDPQFRKLNESDIQLDGDFAESDEASRKKLAMLGAGRGARAPRNAPGTSKRVMSWIWTAQGGEAEGEEHLHESVRVEWCRARARKLRWEEEVLLVAWWEGMIDSRQDAAPHVREGANAYARKQVWVHRRIAEHFQMTWERPAQVVARRVLTGAPSDDLEGADLDEFFNTEYPVVVPNGIAARS
ncbi:hypothetical protein B0H11DRAFT_2256166 [Mycena galericulata]|nr:hypothetical protein B0H11DRAFT_2256166 [Mycena galericulata]